ncbi:MAG: hypothetical protein ABIJ56_22780 [Pseudomonadota bacterium]
MSRLVVLLLIALALSCEPADNRAQRAAHGSQVLAAMARMARAVPLDCALLAAGKISDAAVRADMLVKIGGLFLASGSGEKGKEVLEKAAGEVRALGADYWARQGLLQRVAVTYAQHGLFDEAKKLLERIEEAEVRATVLVQLCVHASRLGSREQASDALSSAKKIVMGFENDYTRARALFAIVQDLDKAGETNRAMAITEAMDSGYLKDCAFEVMARRTIENGQVDRAGGLVGKIGEPVIRVMVLDAIAEKLAEDGKNLEASSALAELLAQAPNLQKQEERLSWMIEAAKKFSDMGMADKAESILDRVMEEAGGMEDRGQKIRMQASAAEKYAGLGKQEKAAQILGQALGGTGSWEAFAFADMAKSAVALAYARIGEHAAALAALRAIKDSDVSGSTILELSGYYAKNGLFDRAGEAAAEAGQSDKTSALAVIGRERVEREELVEAKELAGQMAGGAEKIGLLIDIADGFVESGDNRKAGSAIEEAEGLLAKEPSSDDRAGFVVRLALVMLQAGMVDRAIELIKQGDALAAAGLLVEMHELKTDARQKELLRAVCEI